MSFQITIEYQYQDRSYDGFNIINTTNEQEAYEYIENYMNFCRDNTDIFEEIIACKFTLYEIKSSPKNEVIFIQRMIYLMNDDCKHPLIILTE